MGAVGLGGAFAGLDWFSQDSPFAATTACSDGESYNITALTTANDASCSDSARQARTRPKFSAEGDTLVMRNEDGSYAALASTNSGGSITTLCWSAQGGGNGTLFVGGSFSSLASTSVQNIAAFSLSSSQVSPLGQGVTGPVDTLYCDDAHQEVWAGGFFSVPQSRGNVGRWSTASSSWSEVPFGGLNGRVDTISSSEDGSSLYFGGRFSTRYADSSKALIRNFASVPFAPPNTATTGHSGYLVPYTIPAAASQYGGLSINAGPASDRAEYNDSRSLICPGQGPWLARDNSIASIDILGNAFMTGGGIRVSNALVEGRGTKTFSVTSIPDNEELRLTYTDPATGRNETCTSRCPLSTEASVAAQDFLFVDGSRSLTGLRVVLDSWQGSGSGLSYMQLLSDGVYVSAVQADNEGICGTSNTTVNTVGNWEPATAPSTIPGTEQGYLLSNVPVDNPGDTALILYPWVGSSGYYDMYLVIPGCANLGDCAGRTTVDIAVFAQFHGLPYTMTIDQRVQTDTQVLIYSGVVDASSEQFTPTINLRLSADPAQVDVANYVVVASGVQMVLTGLTDGSEVVPFPGSPSGAGPTGSATSTASAASTQSQDNSLASTETSLQSTETSLQSSDTSLASTASGGQTVVQPTGTSGPTTAASGSPTTPQSQGSATSAQPQGSLTTSTSSTVSSAVPTPLSVRVAYGVFEWPRSQTNVNAENAILANSTESALTQIGFALDTARNASADGANFAVGAIANAGNRVYVGGNFNGNGYKNVVSVDKTSNSGQPLPNGGLDGVVRTIAQAGSKMYFGGDFTGTVVGDVKLQHIASYDASSNQWAGVGGGVDGPVSGIAALQDGIAVAGNFTNIVSANGSTTSTGGYAIYNTSTSEWMPAGVLFGSAAAATGSGSTKALAGRLLGASRNSVKGVATLTTNKDGTASVGNMVGVTFSDKGSAATTPTTRRSLSARLISRMRHNLVLMRADPTPITNDVAVAPATLAGTYWSNSSASGKRVTILGGNFTRGDIGGVAFQSDNTMTGPSPAVTGVVRALAVEGDELYVGGTGVSVPNVGDGLVVFDLAKNAWTQSAVPSLTSSDGETHVNAIKVREKTDILVVAGNFARAGSFNCPAVCLWDTKIRQWQQPGQGAGAITAGEVKSVSFSGEQHEHLVVGGSFTVNGETHHAASYDFDSSTWTPLGSLPGPILALAVNNKNASNVYASGYDASSQKPFLSRWDGNAWNEEQASSALLPGTSIQNLAFVPMNKAHGASGAIEEDRMLMASGDVLLSGSGNMSSALYDGAQWHPYLVGSTATGTLGSASSLFWSESNFSFSLRKYLARGLVVLVAMAIATGLILLIILLILLVAFCLRRNESKHAAPEVFERDDKSEVSSTQNLIHDHVQTALHRSLLIPGEAPQGRSAAVGAGLSAGAVAGAYDAHSADSHYHDARQVQEADELFGVADSSDEGRETVMRYDFTGPDIQTGELSMRAGQRIVILDDEQSDEWWYARDPATGRQGVVPATYGELDPRPKLTEVL